MSQPLFNKVAGLRPATLLKKRLWHRCFPVNFAKFLRTPFLQNTWRLLLTFPICMSILNYLFSSLAEILKKKNGNKNMKKELPLNSSYYKTRKLLTNLLTKV